MFSSSQLIAPSWWNPECSRSSGTLPHQISLIKSIRAQCQIELSCQLLKYRLIWAVKEMRLPHMPRNVQHLLDLETLNKRWLINADGVEIHCVSMTNQRKECQKMLPKHSKRLAAALSAGHHLECVAFRVLISANESLLMTSLCCNDNETFKR